LHAQRDSEASLQQPLWLPGRGHRRPVSPGLCSLVYETPFDAQASPHQARCRYLQPRWADFLDRIPDVGFVGRWWLPGSRMRDCDLKAQEFLHLPAHLRAALWEAQVLQQEKKDQVALSQADPLVPSEVAR
ncbi:hypothetical protein E2I00_002783, partial [Balaenoptera physalus]